MVVPNYMKSKQQGRGAQFASPQGQYTERGNVEVLTHVGKSRTVGQQSEAPENYGVCLIVDQVRAISTTSDRQRTWFPTADFSSVSMRRASHVVRKRPKIHHTSGTPHPAPCIAVVQPCYLLYFVLEHFLSHMATIWKGLPRKNAKAQNVHTIVLLSYISRAAHKQV